MKTGLGNSRARRLPQAGLALCVLSALPTAVAAGPETHDGFFLRLGLGPAGVIGDASLDGEHSLDVNGPGAVLDIAIGGVVAPNLALHGTLTTFAAAEPEVDIKGIGSGTLEDTNFNVSTVGIGLTWYAMPLNLYVSGSAIALQLSLTDRDGDQLAESDTGFGGQIAVGKEWWVSEEWGLGVAGVGLAGLLNGENTLGQRVEWTVGSFGIYFSATYN